MKIARSLAACFLAALALPVAAQHSIEDFIRREKFVDIKLSPTGEYLAATVPVERKTALAILRRSDNKIMASLSIPGDRTHVADFWWVNDERVLISAAEKIGNLEQPLPTGDLYAINADGSRGGILVGQSVQSEGPGTRIQPKKVEDVAAFLVDSLPEDDKFVLISVRPFSNDPYTRLERLDVYNGRRVAVTQAPVRNADFVTDNAGNVRFAYGQNIDLSKRTYHRKAEGGEWALVNDSGRAEYPIGFAPDNKTAYLYVENERGPDSIVAWDTTGSERKELFRDDDTDPLSIIYDHRGEPVGVALMDGLPRTAFFDPQTPTAKLYKKLQAAFAGYSVFVTSTTKDGNVALVSVSSDKNPGDYYLFDSRSNNAEYLLSGRDWIDPQKTASTKPVRFKSRDGLDINGYLTAPVGTEAKNAPLIVLIHGGPYGMFDAWGFDNEVQMLAAHGYAVLQVNFRGSGNYGAAFEAAGRREWGGKMQDDITDATRWAIEQGIADPKRICLYGASYGGYASLMGVAKEPELYRCAAGYVGVYDLPTMHTMGDIQERGSGESYLNQWLGPKDSLASVSPNRMAGRIKVPVFLAAGGEDERAPMKHTEMMEKALRQANVPVEALYYPTEGHGFYKVENQREYYKKLLSFFHTHLGGRPPQ
ncbi:MAG: S9 family peptidase [Xanthomonadaceae bacterium]|nr:S9 family peptidase [Xanthomonadaceae bacterium]